MKNKVIFKIISLALLALLCLSTVSCAFSMGIQDEISQNTNGDLNAPVDKNGGNGGDGGNGGNGGDSGNSGASSAEEELFAELMKAYNASLEYNGAISAKTSQLTNVKTNGEENLSKMTGSMSLDPISKRYFSTTDVNYGEYQLVTREKLFSADGQLYEYSYEKMSGDWNNEDTHFSKLSADFDPAEEYGDLSEAISVFAGGTFKASTFAELKAAHNKVISDVKTRSEKELKKDGAIKEGAVFAVVPEVTIKKSNEEIVLTITHRVLISELNEGSAVMSNYSSVYTRTIAAKDGKIVRVDMEMSGSMYLTEQSIPMPDETPGYTETKHDPGFDETAPEHEMTGKPEYPDNVMTDIEAPADTHPDFVMTEDAVGTAEPPHHFDTAYETVIVTMPTVDGSNGYDTGRYEGVTVVSGKNMAAERVENDEISTTTKISMEMSTNCDISYSFDQSAYDLIDSTLPSNPSDIYDDSDSTSSFIPVVFADEVGMELYFDADYSEPSRLLDLVQRSVNNYLGDRDIIALANPNVKITALYKDAEHTQPIDLSTITAEQILALDAIYVDYTVAEGKTLIIHTYKTVEEYSLEYQIVRNDILGSLDIDTYDGDMEICDSGEYQYVITYDIDEKISINGKETTDCYIVPESGKTYVITHTSVYTDEDFGLEDIIVDMF